MRHINLSRLESVFVSGDSVLKNELSELGCFVLDNCLDVNLVNSAHKAFMTLFSLPSENKYDCFVDKKVDPLGHGFSPFGVAKALDTGIPNLLETWDISPLKINWPKELIDEWTVIRRYQKQLRKVSITGLEIIADSLGLDKHELTGLIDTESIEGIHLIHYPPLDMGYDRNGRRQSMHCDNTLITLIPTPSPVSTGLSIFNRRTKTWEDILIQKGSCLIQAGFLLELITCGAIKANLHTVPNPELGSIHNTSRYSSPFFCSPRHDTDVAPLKKYRKCSSGISISLAELEENYFRNIF